MSATRTFYKACFTIDDQHVYHGYTDGDLWNGFSCPYFEHNEAVRLLTDQGNVWEYQAEASAFAVKQADDPDDYEPEVFNRMTIEVDGAPIEVYAIGAYSWVWDEMECP